MPADFSTKKSRIPGKMEGGELGWSDGWQRDLIITEEQEAVNFYLFAILELSSVLR